MVREFFLASLFVVSAGLGFPAAAIAASATESHTVRRGETLWGISRLHGVSVGELMDLNHLDDSILREGQVLKIPQPGPDPALVPMRSATHIVAKGETFRSIARRYGLTYETLEQANPKIDPSSPKAGAKLIIPAAASGLGQAGPGTGKPDRAPGMTHTVTEKETFRTIGREYGLSEEALARANPGVNPNRLRPGTKLNIPQRPASPREGGAGSGKGSFPAELMVKPEDQPASGNDEADPGRSGASPTRRLYVVSANETPQTISEAFHITVRELYEMNGLIPDSPLEEGAEILVPAAAPRAP